MEKPEGKRPGRLGRPRRRGEDNINMAFRKWVVCMTGSSCFRIGKNGGHL